MPFGLKVNKHIKKWRKEAKKTRRYCKKHFPDWRDDEYNCGDLKFIWGMPYYTEINTPSFATLNLATVYYSRIHKKYYLDIDTEELNRKPEHFFEKLFDVFLAFQDYLYITCELPRQISKTKLKQFITFDFSADSLEDLFYQFYIILNGIQKDFNYR